MNQQHQLDGLLEKSLQQFEAAAQKIAVDFIQDAKFRQEYMRQIAEVPKLVRAEVAAGRVGLEEGVRFAQTLRNQIMKETLAQQRRLALSRWPSATRRRGFLSDFC
ncbi:hypothetical protein WL52_04370 [Burkholderia ubonensis]|nr:hypothetical protein WL52_04370 [Burkholderia ubonensis]